MDPSQSAGRSVLTTFKLVALCAAAQVVGTFGILIAAGLDFTRPKTLWIAVPLTVGLADIVLVPAVGSTVRPLPFGPGAEDLRRIATGALRTLILLRLALAEAAALFGLLSAVLAHSLVPYAIGAVFAIPLLLGYTYPSQRVVATVRQRLESAGVPARLGAGPPRARPAPTRATTRPANTAGPASTTGPASEPGPARQA